LQRAYQNTRAAWLHVMLTAVHYCHRFTILGLELVILFLIWWKHLRRHLAERLICRT